MGEAVFAVLDHSSIKPPSRLPPVASPSASRSPGPAPGPASEDRLPIALTGATGFVGAAITDHFLAQGHKVVVLVRSPARLHRPDDVEIITGDLADNTKSGNAALEDFAARAPILIHCAGLTHARRNRDFATVNVAGAARMAAAFGAAPQIPAVSRADDGGGAKPGVKRFVHISSLAARQPDISAYARSKFESEGAIRDAITSARCPERLFERAPSEPSPSERPFVTWVTLRAPALYGPRDMATLPFFKAVKRGLAPIPGGRAIRRASILHVDDFARAVYAAVHEAPPDQLYEVGDQLPDGHSWAEIAAACASALGVTPRTLAVPKALLLAWAAPSSLIMRAIGRAPMVTPDKIAEFFHPDWAARDHLLGDHTRWAPQIPLKEGFASTAMWYHQHAML